VSLNVPAVSLSLKVGREKVVEMTQRLGVTGVKKTCSMALGDTGITPLEHTSAYAVFAHGGKLSKPYAILEIFNSKGDLIYSREQEEPPAPQVLSTKVVENMNLMMQAVVNEGTGKAATLDFTTAAGKTGTSTNYRDAWFVGFTGALVAGVWVGYDDFRPMNNITGGSLPAKAWHAFMSVAHNNRYIPQIVGLPLHPNQIAEQQRLAELKRTDPGLAKAQIAQAAPKKASSIMPDQTRDVLKKLVETMRRANGAEATPTSVRSGADEPAASKGRAPEQKARPAPPAGPDRRAEAPGADAQARPR
jgi:penicillin-binding protein 1A